MNKFKIISYHTPNGIYPQMAERLKQSCISVGVDIDVDVRNDLGSWVKNCAYKAEYIREKLQGVPENDCVVWIDSDAKIISYPYLFNDISEDFGIRARPGARKIKPAGREYIDLPIKWQGDPAWFESGTIFLRNIQSIRDVLDLWIKLGHNNNKWDQWTLQEAWCEIKPRTVWLPQSYCQIHKIHGDHGAVILHDLASVLQKVNRK